MFLIGWHFTWSITDFKWVGVVLIAFACSCARRHGAMDLVSVHFCWRPEKPFACSKKARQKSCSPAAVIDSMFDERLAVAAANRPTTKPQDSPRHKHMEVPQSPKRILSDDRCDATT